MMSVIGLFVLAGALCAGAVYGWFGYYWSEYRRVVKAERRPHWMDRDDD